MSISATPQDAPNMPDSLSKWIADFAELAQPDSIFYIYDFPKVRQELTDQLVERGTLHKLDESRKPNSYLANSDPADVARVESRTFICSQRQEDAGPTNNWTAPDEMRSTMTKLYKGCMKGRTMYVIPYTMGPLESPQSKIGVEITDSAYVVLSMGIMARVGKPVWERINKGEYFVKCLHSVGAPLEPGQQDVQWPHNPTKYISHFPEDREIWSYGSGYGGNSLLGKKCFALRIASAMARDEGWMAEHMLILKLISPENKNYYVTAAFPSACGKTNLAMIQPTIPGWRAETIGDDIAWLRFGEDGRLYAINPEAGFFGVAPGTNAESNPNAIKTLDAGNTIYTNVALTDDNDVWWEDLSTPPAHLTDWKGNSWEAATAQEPAAHPNSRYCTPISQCPSVAPEWETPQGVPISAILFGGRRKTTVPLVTESFDWEHGVFIGSTIGSEQTAAAEGTVGKVRRDPMAMLPFIGYHVADYFQHWIDLGVEHAHDALPKIFYVNWFRRGEDGRFLWPGFGENSRVLDWIIRRVEGTTPGTQTPIGIVPSADELNLDGLDVPSEDVAAALAVNNSEWERESAGIEEWYASIGEKLPEQLRNQLDALKNRISST